MNTESLRHIGTEFPCFHHIAKKWARNRAVKPIPCHSSLVIGAKINHIRLTVSDEEPVPLKPARETETPREVFP